MRSGMMLWVSLAGLGLVALDSDLESQDAPESPPVREIALDTLHDLAVAVYDPNGSIIYYNPAYMQRLGPQLSAFFMAHEYGHLSLRHTRAHALAGQRKSFNAKLQQQELAADCYAASQLARDNPSAVEATIHFFRRMGPFRYDAAHPSGSQRAAKILSCLPRENQATAGESVAVSKGASDDSSPPGMGITVAAPVHSDRVPWQEIQFRIGTIQSAVSNLHQPNAVALQTLAPGTYEYELRVNVFYLDEQFQLNPSGSITGSGTITIQGGETFRVESSPEGDAKLTPSK
jgi:hypothetical protein